MEENNNNNNNYNNNYNNMNIERLLNSFDRIMETSESYHLTMRTISENIYQTFNNYIVTSERMFREENELFSEIIRTLYPRRNTRQFLPNSSTNIFSRQLPTQQTQRPQQQSIQRQRRNASTGNDFLNLFDFLTTNMNSSEYRLRPRRLSAEEIDQTCTRLLFSDVSSNITQCPISLEELSEDDFILKINHCGHIFKEENLRRVFETNSLCPLCRYNLLEELNIEQNSQISSNTNQTNLINNSTNIQQQPLLNMNQRTIRPPNSNNSFQSNSYLFSRLINTHTDRINPQNDLSGNIYSLQSNWNFDTDFL